MRNVHPSQSRRNAQYLKIAGILVFFLIVGWMLYGMVSDLTDGTGQHRVRLEQHL